MALFQKIEKFFCLFFGVQKPCPQEIQIEITNRCNFTCSICPRKLIGAKQKDITWKTFRKAIDALERPRTITLTGWGEPLLHKDLSKMIKYINQKFPKSKIKFTTNGSLLNQTWARNLLKSNIYEISFSIDAIQSNSAGHQNNTRILDNIKNFIKIRGSKKLPLISLQTIISQKGYRDLKDVIEFAAANKVDKINLIRLIKYPGSKLSRPSSQNEQRIIKRAKRAAKKLNLKFLCLNQFNLFRYLATGCDRKCLKTDNHLYITVDGKAAPCCNLRNRVCGDLGEQNLSQIWTNKKFKHFRAEQEKICAFCDALAWKQKKPQ